MNSAVINIKIIHYFTSTYQLKDSIDSNFNSNLMKCANSLITVIKKGICFYNFKKEVKIRRTGIPADPVTPGTPASP